MKNRNFEILSKLYPSLAEELEKPESAGAGNPGESSPAGSSASGAEPPGAAEIRIEAASSGDPTLILGGRHVHSPRDPVREAERLALSLGGQDSGGKVPIVILGFGLGYAAEAAARAAPDRPLIIAESRRSLLRRALEERDLSSFLGENTLAFVVGGNGESAIQAALGLFAAAKPEAGKPEAGKPAIIRNRALMVADAAWYAAVERGIRSYLSRSQVNSATLRRFGRRWVRNLGRNMEAIRDLPGIARLEGILAAGDASPAPSAPSSPGAPPAGGGAPGIPVFLAAAGPSLDQAAPLLGEIQKRCVIVAVDTSLRFLLRWGLAPDFAMSVDGQYWNFRHLDRCAAPETWLIAESAVYPPVLRHPFRGTFLCGSHLPLGRFIEDRVDPKGVLGAGGSVATSAWDFARFLGAPAVWIAGLDLSFPDLKTHFKGALFEGRSHGESRRFVPAETWSFRALRDGEAFSAPAAAGQVLTDRRLSLYASWFAGRFREFPSVRNYRLGFQGLAIPGLESIAPETILELPERRGEINALLEEIHGRIGEEFREGGEDRARRYREAREKLLGGLENLMALAAKAADLAEKGLGGYPPKEGLGESPAGGGEILRRLDAALESIKNSEVKDVAAFLVPSTDREGDGGDLQNLGGDLQDPGRVLAQYLEISQRTFRALAEAAEYHLETLGRAKWQSAGCGSTMIL
jgi:hypothetical protein